MALQWQNLQDKFIELHWDSQLLFRYVYLPDLPRKESPKPYFHPVCSLAGECLTNFRPHDHKWHHGISLTCTDINGHNFWGGGTYVHGEGYKMLDNFGCQAHRAWERLDVSADWFEGVERLDWMGHDNRLLMSEVRRIRVDRVDAADKVWRLSFASALTNRRDDVLQFASPTTKGRPMAGYGGFFWRGPRSFRDGIIRQAPVETPPDRPSDAPPGMGLRAPWLAFTGKHDGSDNTSTLLFMDHPDNPRYPTKWFVRNTPFACASFAFMFDEAYRLPPGETLALQYSILLADGHRDNEWIEEQARNHDAGSAIPQEQQQQRG